MRLAGLDVPQLDGEVARGGGEYVLGGGVEVDLSDFPAGGQRRDGLGAGWGSYFAWPESLPTGPTSGISSASTRRVKSLGTCQMKTLPSSEPEATMSSLKGFLQDHVSRGLAPRRAPSPSVDVPVGVQNSGSVAPEQRDLLGQLPPLLERDHGERAAAARLPVDGEVLGVDLERTHISSQLPPIVSRCQGRRREAPGQGLVGAGEGMAVVVTGRGGSTLTRLVSQAFLLMRRLS